MISVIIPTFGRPQNLLRAIKSVQSQSIEDWEIIVVDDNNPNTSDRIETEKLMQDVVDKIQNVSYIQHSHNKNGSAARNTGLAKAKGDYVTFLDDDDEFLSSRFEECINVLTKTTKKYAGVYTGCVFYHEDKYYKTLDFAITGNFLVEVLATTFQSHSGSNLFLKTDIVRELNGFDENFIRHQDYEFLVRLFSKYDMIGISKPLMIKHENGKNIPDIGNFIKVKELYLYKYNSIINSLSKDDSNYIFHSQYAALAIIAIKNKRYDLFRYYFNLAKSYKSFAVKDLLRIIKSFVF